MQLPDNRTLVGGLLGFAAGVSANSVNNQLPFSVQQLISLVAEAAVVLIAVVLCARLITKLFRTGHRVANAIWSKRVAEWAVAVAFGLASIGLLIGLVQLGWAAVQGKVSSFWVVLVFLALGVFWRQLSPRTGAAAETTAPPAALDAEANDKG
jgi:dipeptide/tripeptide permease